MINLVENAINIVLAVVLADRFGVLGPGRRVRRGVRRVGGVELAGALVQGARATRCGTLSRGCTECTSRRQSWPQAVWLVARLVGGNTGIDALVRVAVGTVTGVVVYLCVLLAMRAPEVGELRRRLGR